MAESLLLRSKVIAVSRFLAYPDLMRSRKCSRRNILQLCLLGVSVALTGRQNVQNPILGTHLTGAVFGGQQPVRGSAIQLYAVGTTGDGSAATPLIGATVTTSDGSGQRNSNANAGNANNSLPAGSFTITGDYTCPTSRSPLTWLTTHTSVRPAATQRAW
jgi:hypothetical protein